MSGPSCDVISLIVRWSLAVHLLGLWDSHLKNRNDHAGHQLVKLVRGVAALDLMVGDAPRNETVVLLNVHIFVAMLLDSGIGTSLNGAHACTN